LDEVKVEVELLDEEVLVGLRILGPGSLKVRYEGFVFWSSVMSLFLPHSAYLGLPGIGVGISMNSFLTTNRGVLFGW
jgi:hypothetical protein